MPASSCEADFRAFTTFQFFNVSFLNLRADSMEDEEDCRGLLQAELTTMLRQYITVLFHQSLLRRQNLLLPLLVGKEEDGEHRVIDSLKELLRGYFLYFGKHFSN